MNKGKCGVSQGAESLLKGLKIAYMHVEIVEKENGYWILKATNDENNA